MSFKVGDKVRRASHFIGVFKDKTTVWEVLQDHDGFLQVKSGDYVWWSDGEFVVVEDPPSIPGIPEGYRAVRYGELSDNTPYLDSFARVRVWRSENESGCQGLIVEKITESEDKQPPVESPDDWVEITDPEHVLRADDELNGCLDSVKELGIEKSLRCRRRDLPVAKPATEQITFHQVITKINDNDMVLQWVNNVRGFQQPTGETCVVEVPVRR